MNLSREAARQPPPPILKVDSEVMTVPPPNLQTLPTLDLTAFRAREDSVLHSNGWVDKAAGVVRIPIDEAMRLLVERGVQAPVAATPSPAATTPSSKAASEAKR